MAKYGITSQSQMIDIGAINNGCTKIEAAAENFAKCAKLILEGSEICNENALSVDKTTMQPQLEADAQYIESMKAALTSFTTEVRNLAVQIYAEQESELATYIAEQQKKSANN